MLVFYWPWMALLLLLPLGITLSLLTTKDKENISSKELEIRFPALAHLSKSFPAYFKVQNQNKKVFLILLSLLWISLVLAMMRPQLVGQLIHVENEGYDIILAVDISGSMLALDFSSKTKMASRLDATKEVVGKFVKDRNGDRIGLVLFGEHAYLHVPLTLDTTSVAYMLNNILPGMAGNTTAIGDALGLAVHTLRTRPEGSRIVILLTDGDDNASSIPPLKAASLAKQYGIRVYTIGIGRDGEVPYPDGFGGVTMVKLSMNEELLRSIAAATDGQYFKATNTNALQSIYDQINKMETTIANTREYLIRESLHRYPLSVASILLICLILIPLHRREMVYGI